VAYLHELFNSSLALVFANHKNYDLGSAAECGMDNTVGLLPVFNPAMVQPIQAQKTKTMIAEISPISIQTFENCPVARDKTKAK
jgi:hypothetical protein